MVHINERRPLTGLQNPTTNGLDGVSVKQVIASKKPGVLSGSAFQASQQVAIVPEDNFVGSIADPGGPPLIELHDLLGLVRRAMVRNHYVYVRSELGKEALECFPKMVRPVVRRDTEGDQRLFTHLLRSAAPRRNGWFAASFTQRCGDRAR